MLMELREISLKQNIEYFHYLITSFNACAGCLSYASGIQFISACNENELFLKSGITLGTVDVECDNINKDSYNNDLFEIKSNLNPSEHKYCFLRKPTSQWIRYANELLQANIDHKKIEFASASLGHPLSYVANKIELTKIQASKIEVTSNPQGSLTFNLPLEFQHSKDKDRFRKDNYQALLLGNWMVKVYFDSLCAKPNDSKKKFTKSIAPTKSCKGFLPLSSGKIIPMDKINYIGPLESIKGSGYCGVYCYITVSNMVFHLTEEDHKEIVEKIRSSK